MSPPRTLGWGGCTVHTEQTTEANGNIVMGDIRLLLSEVREGEGERREGAIERDEGKRGEIHAPLRGVTALARKDTWTDVGCSIGAEGYMDGCM